MNFEGLATDLPDLDGLIDANAEFDHKAKGFTKARRARSVNVTTFDARRVKCARDTILRLPGPGEYIHTIVSQSYAGFDMLPAMLELSHAARFDELTLTTLGFSRDNLAQLETMIRAGQIIPTRLRVLCGDFFRRADSGLWDIGKLLAKEHGYGWRSYRNHTKLILATIRLRRFVVESSANLRSCQNVEQFTITENPDLYRFHMGWIAEVWKESKQ